MGALAKPDITVLPPEILYRVVGLLDDRAFCAAREAHRCFCVHGWSEISVARVLPLWRVASRTTNGTEAICRSGYLPGVRLLYDHGFVLSGGTYPWDKWNRHGTWRASPTIIDLIAYYGHLPMIEFLHKQGVQGTATYAVDFAAGNGHLDVVEFLCENTVGGHSTHAMDDAAAGGYLDIVAYLHGRGASCTTDAMDEAAAGGHLAVVEYLHNRGYMCTIKAMNRAAANGHLGIVEYLHRNRSEGCTTHAMEMAASNGHLDIIKFLHNHRSEGCGEFALVFAITHEHPDVALFLAENCAGVRTYFAIDWAIESPYEQVARALCVHAKPKHMLHLISVAAESGHVEVQRILVDLYKRANPSMNRRNLSDAIDDAIGDGIDRRLWPHDEFERECARSMRRMDRTLKCMRRSTSPPKANPIAPAAIVRAAKMGDVRAVRLAAEDYPECARNVDAMYYAAVGGHSEIVDILCRAWPASAAQGKVDPAGNVVGFNRSLMVAKYHWSSFEAALYWKSTRKHRGGLTVQGVVASFAHHRYREKGREEDPNKGEMTDTDRQRACGLEHMPPEVLLHITSFIERARDMAAALMASPLLAGRSAVEMAIEYGAVYTGRLLESGAPLNTIKSAVDRRKRPLGRGFIECAVRGGRMDVLRFVCSRVTDDITESEYDPFTDDYDPGYSYESNNDGDDDDGTKDKDDDDSGDDDGDDDDGGDDDDDKESYSGGAQSLAWDHVDEYIERAVRAAVALGRLDALRYLTTRSIAGESCTSNLIGRDLMIDAARAGHVAIVAHIHDRLFDSDYDMPCACDYRVGRAAWKAPTPDAIAWMRDYGCQGYETPTVDSVCYAIAQGRTAMLKRMLHETETGAIIDIDLVKLEPSIAAAASRNHMDTLVWVVDRGMCPRIGPIIVGAARGGNVDILWWALRSDNAGPYRANWGTPTTMTMRAAAIAAAVHDHSDAIAWIAQRYRGVIDLAVLCAAVNNGSLSAVRTIDALLPAPLDWQRMVARVVAANSVDMLEFLVKEKGIALDPLAIADADIMSDAVIEYVSRTCARDNVQQVLDIILVDDNFEHSPRAKRFCEQIPHLCTAIAHAADTAPINWCTCLRCGPKDDVTVPEREHDQPAPGTTLSDQPPERLGHDAVHS